MIKDKIGIPIIKGDVLKFFHFIGSRRKKHYMYKYVLDVDSKYYKIGHLPSDPGKFEKSYFFIVNNGQRLPDVEIVQVYCEKKTGDNAYQSIFIEDRLKNIDFIKEILGENKNENS